MNRTPFYVAALLSLGVYACFVDNPDEAQPYVDAGVDATVAAVDSGTDADTAVDASDASTEEVDAGPPLCTKYGGYGTVIKIISDLFGSLLADCRISTFFSTLSAEQQGHLGNCLEKQVAVVLGCPGIKYDVDNQGVECRDMKTSHAGLAIRGDDFDALVGDLVAVLQNLGVADADIAAVAPSLLALRDDIVTNSAPGLARTTCEADGGE